MRPAHGGKHVTAPKHVMAGLVPATADRLPTFVMAGLVPAIHDLLPAASQDVDARHKAGHDGDWDYWHRIIIIALALIFGMPESAYAADPVAGRKKAAQCQICHGLDGLSKLPDGPHIAGQPEPYLVRVLNEYRKGIRKHEMMSLVVQPLTDADVADLAAYYSAIEISVKPPQ